MTATCRKVLAALVRAAGESSALAVAAECGVNGTQAVNAMESLWLAGLAERLGAGRWKATVAGEEESARRPKVWKRRDRSKP